MARYFIDEEKYNELIGFKVVPGDLIISCSGVTLGRIAEIPQNAFPGIINQALLKISLDNRIMNSTYFKYLFRHSRIQDILFGISRGSGIPNFPPMQTIKAILFPTPPIELQNKFAAIIAQIYTQKELTLNSLHKSEELFQSLLQRAFRGELA
jgi:type I restriction enzyme S subunit